MVAVVSILLLAVGLVLFTPFIGETVEFISKSGDTATCKFSLFQGKGTAKCPIGKASIFKDEVRLDDKRFMGRGSEGTQNMAKEALAKLLSTCLSKGGGYNSRAFSSENWVSTESVCLECFKVTVDESAGIVKDFTDYLRDTTVKGSIPEKKYIEVLTRDQQHLKAYMEYGMGLGLAPSKGTFEFKPNQDYTIFFIGLKKGFIPKLPTYAKNVWNAVTLNFLEITFGNQDTYFAYIAESEKIPQVCDRKVN